MKIKQQKQIKAFLIEEFGKDSGISLFNEQEKTLNALIESTKDKTKNQMKTLCQTILPRIARYKTLLSDDTHKENAYECMRKYMLDKVAAKKHSSTKKWKRCRAFTRFTVKSF